MATLSRFRPELEGLRGLAVALVVVAHAGLPIPGAAIGPDIFFVLSGYLITGILLRRLEAGDGIGLAHFYARRFRRILPAISATVLLTVGVVALLGDPYLLATTAGDGAAAIGGVANIHFGLTATDYFSAERVSPLLPLWSIGVEEQFYLVAPLLVAGAFALRRRHGVALLMALLAAGSTLAAVVVSVTDPVWAYYLLPTRAYGLAAGGLLAIVAPQLARLRLPLASVGLAALAALIVAAPGGTGYPGLVGPAAALASFALIAGLEGSRLRHLFTALPVRLIGRISYSLYLVHFPFLALPPLFGVTMDLAATLLAVGGAVATAGLLYVLVERPFRDGLFFGASPRRVLLRATAVLAAGLLSMGGIASSLTPASASVGEAEQLPAPVVVAAPSPDVSTTPAPYAPIVLGGTSDFLYEGPLPADLRPAIGRAAWDADTTKASGCGVDRGPTAPRKICRLGQPGGQRIVLIGDSHAAHWMPALESAGKANGWEIIPLTKSNCPFVDYAPLDERLGRPYDECATWNAGIAEAANRLDPALVLVSSVWYSDPARPGTSQRVYVDELAGMLARFTAPVGMIGDITWNGTDLPSCLARNRDEIAACVIRNEAPNAKHGWSIARAATERLGLPFIDPRPALCPRTSACPPVIDGIVVLHDHHHLTVTMSRHLAGPLAAAIAPLLPARVEAPHTGPGGR